MASKLCSSCLSPKCKVYTLTVVIGIYFLLELVTSHLTHSLTLLIDAYHSLYNIVGMIGFIIAMKMSGEHTLKNTFGWARIGVLGMLISTLALAALSFSVVVEAIQTTIHASHFGNEDDLHMETRSIKLNMSLGLRPAENDSIFSKEDVTTNIITTTTIASTALHTVSEASTIMLNGIGVVGAANTKGDNSSSTEASTLHTTTVGSTTSTYGDTENELDAMHHPMVVLCIGVLGMILNLVCFLVISGLNHTPSFVSVDKTDVQVNVTVPQEVSSKSKYWRTNTDKNKSIDEHALRKRFLLDFCRDMSCSILVVVCAIIVYMVDDQIAIYIDPVLSMVSVVIIMSTIYPFFKESGMILMQTVPNDMDVSSLKMRLLKEFPSITNVHDLHIWRLTRTKVIATVHIKIASMEDYVSIAPNVSEFFTKEDIVLSTVQPEFDTNDQDLLSSDECILKCRNGDCRARRCCKEDDEEDDLDNEFQEIRLGELQEDDA